MKRIIDGVTYNTDTSTRLASAEYESEYNFKECPCEGTLYQTRGGAFFVHEVYNLGFDRENERNDYRHKFEALSPDDAQKWIMTGEIEIFHNPFDEPPEAVAENVPSATIYVRVPVSLKQRLEQSAKAEKLSGNAWAIRCIENCLEPNDYLRSQVARMWFYARTIELNDESFTTESLQKMAGEIAQSIKNNWKDLGFAISSFTADIDSCHGADTWHDEVKDYPKEGE